MAFTTSQWISSMVLVASIIFYFAARTGLQQNAFLYVFGVALLVLVVGKFFTYFKIYFSWMNEDSSMNHIMKIGKREEMPKCRLEKFVNNKLWFCFVLILSHEFNSFNFFTKNELYKLLHFSLINTNIPVSSP